MGSLMAVHKTAQILVLFCAIALVFPNWVVGQDSGQKTRKGLQSITGRGAGIGRSVGGESDLDLFPTITSLDDDLDDDSSDPVTWTALLLQWKWAWAIGSRRRFGIELAHLQYDARERWTDSDANQHRWT